MRRPVVALSLALFGTLSFATAASAHPERPSYWPDPAADTSVRPAAGGTVPKPRAIGSLLAPRANERVHVVCSGPRGRTSLQKLEASIQSARTSGYRLRPSQPVIRLNAGHASFLRFLNRSLARRCAFNSVQSAVNASRNNDRIVIMPGHYTEPRSRAARTSDPRCNPSMLQQDASGDPTPSYEYQVTCPNDQNLIYVAGRAVGPDPPEPPRSNRHGIPDNGPCIRCNLQIDGTGVKAEDVILDAGSGYGGRHLVPTAKPSGASKHVVMRVDRADGFVGRNFLTRGGSEFGYYTEETDGVLLDRVKFFWSADYGHLSFTTDHHVVRNCEGFGAGDAVVYPGAAPETGSQATSFYPDAPRDNTVIEGCDLHGSALGYSGSMGNAVRITRNHIYGNTTGIATDTLSSAGHPGFPADSSHIDNNFIYSNNLDLYRPDAPVKILITVPIGTGIIYAGANDSRVTNNWFFDNWREAARLLAVPDALTSAGGGEGDVDPGISCPGAPANGISTSCGNQFFGNRLGQVPPGFRFPAALDIFGVPHAANGSSTAPNGLDFWWDEFATNTGNCWFNNRGPDGSEGSVTGPGPGTPPDILPSNCAASVGNGDAFKEAVLVDCAMGPDEDTGPLDCPWWQTPPRPGSSAASRQRAETAEAARRFDSSDEANRLRRRVGDLTSR